MTTDEAIEILSEAAHGHSFTTGPKFYAAIQLSIEALKRCKLARIDYYALYQLPLPGETVA